MVAMELPSLQLEQFAPTRNYLQDIARIMGKVQQVFLPAEIHDWQRGLEVMAMGLITQDLGQSHHIVLHVHDQVLVAGDEQWPLGQPATTYLGLLKNWAAEHSGTKEVESSELITIQPTYDHQQAQDLTTVMWWAYQQLAAFRQSWSRFFTSPVLLFPHHFDVSLVWFADREQAKASNSSAQMSFGFSFGDDTISEPYWYITAYPEPANFTKLELTPPAYWQRDGFSGAVLKYNDLLKVDKLEQALQSFFKQVFEHTQRLFS